MAGRGEAQLWPSVTWGHGLALCRPETLTTAFLSVPGMELGALRLHGKHH